MIFVQLYLSLNGIEIPQRYIINFAAKSSRIDRTQTAEIELVKKKLIEKSDLLKEKTKVVLKACYKNRYPLTTLFEGVITKPNLKQRTIKLKCEDMSYLLKNPVTLTFKKIFDGTIIKHIAGKLANTSNVKNRRSMRVVSFTQKSMRWIINYLAEKSLSDYFFIGEKLYYGKKYSFADVDEIPVIDLDGVNVVENLLNWHEGIQNLKVIVTSTDENNKTYTGVYGKGSNIVKRFDASVGKSGVQDKAKAIYKELSFVGYEGSLKMLLEPVIFHSHPLDIIDNGVTRTAYADSVEYSFGLSSGLRQNIKVGEQEKEPKKKKKRYQKGLKRRKNKLRGKKKK